MIQVKKKEPPETTLKRMVKQYLKLQGAFVFPILQSMGCFAGIADMVMIHQGFTVFLEIKAPAIRECNRNKPPGKQRLAQIKFEEKVVEHGGYYFLITSLEDMEIMFKTLGIEVKGSLFR